MAYATNSLGNYSGTIVSSPIRPFGPNELIATVFSNEIRGGHHNYELLSERDSLIEVRRDWGMLVTVYNDVTASNNKTYKLAYNYYSTSITDNFNWVEYNPFGISTLINTEWIDSVQEIATNPSIFTDGYRYLVDSGGAGLFTGQDGKIAQYSSSLVTFNFYEPTNGTTLRVDNLPNIIYRYSGTYSTGSWVTEIQNGVRYLSANSLDGITYSATSSQALLRDYFDSVYYVNFSVTSSGTVSLIIDGLTASFIYKLENNVLNQVSSNDLLPGIQYQLIYNGTGFQTTLPSSSTTTIGPAEDGNYTDGLFTDFTTSTPIGTPIDRFNEFFLNLVPLSGPTLSSWDATSSFVNGGLSFDNSTSGTFSSATSSPYGAVSAGSTFSSADNYYRLGIMSKVLQPITGTQYFQDISGVLNIDVTQSTQTPFPSYATYSFGFADSGTISFYLNGVTISSFGLTGGAVDTTISGATSGLLISAPTASRFSSGNYFENYQNRTGSYLLKNDCSEILSGYNYFIIQHETNTVNYILDRFEFVTDDSVLDVDVASPAITTAITPFQKSISGISFFTSPAIFVYTGTIQNLFSNTFNQDVDGLTYFDFSNQLSSLTNSVTLTTTNGYTSSITLPTLNFETLVPSGVIDPTATMTINMTYSINSGIRRVDDSIGFGVQVKRTVQGTFIGGTSSTGPIQTSNWFFDTVSSTSTTYSENFDDEDYRLINGSTKYNTYNLVSDLTTATWSSLASLISDTSHYNGLQVINGLLIYPKFDFSFPGPGNAFTNPNYGLGSSRNYSNCFSISSGFGTYSASPFTNNRTYTRWFFFGNSSPVSNYSSGTLKINYENVTFVNTTLPLSGIGSSNPNSDVWVEIKLPYDSGVVPGGTVSTGSVTGWLDATLPFNGSYEDGDGCLSGSVPTFSGGEWLVDFGIKGTEFSGGYVLLRITAGQDWLGNISSIIFTPN
jgi:hypothetical protein